jgi:hypothetical protein
LGCSAIGRKVFSPTITGELNSHHQQSPMRVEGIHTTGCWPVPQSWGSSVSIVSDYGLDYRAIGVRSRGEAEDFSCSLCV